MTVKPIALLGLGLLASSAALAVAAIVADTGGLPPKTGTDEGWKQHSVQRPKPPVVEPVGGTIAAQPPKDAVVLFDGANLDAWQGSGGGPAKWKVDDGAFVVVPGEGAIRTKAEFGDAQIHVEWASPSPAKGKGQDRGNTGLFLMGIYEVQILDSYKADTYADGQAGAMYGQYPPLFNASKPPGEWQTYDIAFRRPRFDSGGKVLEPARLTLFHNGILVQNNEEYLGITNWLHWGPYQAHGDTGPIELQDHGHPVKFRNFWVRNMPQRPLPTAEALKRPDFVELDAQALEKFTGAYGSSASEKPSMTVSREDDHLLVKFPFLPDPLPILPTSKTEFAFKNTDGRFFFKVEDDKVTGVRFEIGDGERAMKKLER